MKILFVAGSLGRGGAEKQLFYLCDILTKNNFEVCVLSFTKNEYYENEIIKLGIKILHIENTNNKILKLINIYQLAKKFNPNVIYGFHFYTGFYVGMIGIILRTVSIGSIRSNGFNERQSNGLFSWLHYFSPNIIIANSKNAIENAHHVFYNKNVQYLPNIIDLDFFKFQKKDINNEINLLFIGSLKEIKQPNLFIDLVRMLIKNKLKVNATIIGNGEMYQHLKNDANDLPITFYKEIDDVRTFLYQADYLVSTSKYEGTPNVILEAFSTGTPVMALYHDGLKHWIVNKNLLKISTIDEMYLLILQSESANLDLNRKFVQNYHSKSIVLNDFLKIISIN
jgi:glycosyltransferase involved in cell wall biosynthesis